MINLQEKKEETLGFLDAIISLLESLHNVSFNISGVLPSSSDFGAKETSEDAFDYLFQILKSMNGKTEDILDWICNILEKGMPVMEAATKAILLANIKSEVNCGSDPIIPNNYREWYYNSEYALYRNKHWNDKLDMNYTDTKMMQIIGVSKGEGIQIDLGGIDFLDKLKYNPCAEGGNLMYFGTNTKMSPYALCRADDMDAFIWFTMNKAKFYSAYQIPNTIEELESHFNAEYIVKVENDANCFPSKMVQTRETEDTKDLFSLFEFFFVDADKEKIKNVACGTAIKYQNSNTIAICTNVSKDSYDAYAQFFPCSDSYQGAMWYIDSYCYHGKDLIWTSTSDDELASHNAIYGNVGTTSSDEKIDGENAQKKSNTYSHPRNYEKEFPIFKLEYDAMTSGINKIPSSSGLDTTTYGSSVTRNSATFHLKILPKPFIAYPQMDTSKFQQLFVSKKIKFNSYGYPDSNGHYSCYIDPNFTATYDRTVVSTNGLMPDASVKYTFNISSSDTQTTSITAKTNGSIESTATTPTTTTTSVVSNCEKCYFNFKNGEMQEYVDGGNTPDGYKPAWRYHVITGKQFNKLLTTTNINKDTSEQIAYLVIGPTGDYRLFMKDSNALPQECLYPCYTPSTIYQFNYQYVMGMQLFNAKQILCSALDFTLGFNTTLEIGLTEKQGTERQRIIKIIKDMCESVDSSSISDCFYSFSNKKYESMLNESDKKRRQGYQFQGSDNQVNKVDTSKVEDILNSYNDNATLNERTDTLKRSIREVGVSITYDGEETADRVEGECGLNYEFLKELVQNMTVSMISSLITPKVIMLFKVNQELMGNYDEYDSIEDFLKANEAIVLSLVAYIRDLILEELLAFVLDKLKIIIALWSTEIIKEYTEKIQRLLTLLKEDWYNCIPDWTKQRTLLTTIPIVNYADIDNNQAPVTEKCE